jgi:hypothetical protein
MKQKDVVINNEYMTKVGDELVKARVVQERQSLSFQGNVRRFTVRRVDNGALLPKARTAAALRPIRSTS